MKLARALRSVARPRARSAFVFFGVVCMAFLGARSALGQSGCPLVAFQETRHVPLPGTPVPFDPGAPLVFVPDAGSSWEGNFPRRDPRASRLHAVLSDREALGFVATIGLPERGEVTGVVSLSGNQALVTLLNADKPLTGDGTLQLVGLDGVKARVEVGPQPVSLALSRDGRFVVVANAAELPPLPDLRRYRDEPALAASYLTAAQSLVAGLPEKLGFGDARSLLRALKVSDAAGLLETAVDGHLMDRLADVALKLGFVKVVVTPEGRLRLAGDLALFAEDRGYDGVEGLLGALSPHVGTDAVFDEFLRRGLVAERAADDRAGGVTVVHFPAGGAPAVVVAHVPGEAIHERLRAEAPGRSAGERAIAVKSVAIAVDSSFALATLQEQNAVISVDLRLVGELMGRPDLSARDIGAAALLDVVLLPDGFRGVDGVTAGVRPDGIGISGDGALAVTANAARSSSDALPHKQGISLIDLRRGPADLRLAATYSVFDLSPDLLEDTRLARAPVQAAGETPPPAAGLLPRIDPAGLTVVDLGCQTFAAVALERFEKSARIADLPPLSGAAPEDPDEAEDADDPSGSVLLLDLTDALAGIDAARPDANGRGGYVPSCLRRLGVGGSAKQPRHPRSVSFSGSSGLLYAEPGNEGSWVGAVPVSLLADLGHILAIEPTQAPGVYDVELTTSAEIAALSFGMTISGECGTVQIASVDVAETLADHVEVFTQADAGRGRTIEMVGALSRLGCSLEEAERLTGPGEGIRIARVKLCGTALDPAGCRLVLVDLGRPTVPVALVAADDARVILPQRRSAPVPAAGALCFRRGDADQDGRLTFSDVLFGLQNSPAALCQDALDFDDDGRVTIADSLGAMQFLFNRSSPPPAAPGHVACGPDPTPDELGCQFYEGPCRE